LLDFHTGDRYNEFGSMNLLCRLGWHKWSVTFERAGMLVLRRCKLCGGTRLLGFLGVDDETDSATPGTGSIAG